METELMKIEMTPEEYQEYRTYQKRLEDVLANQKQKDDMIRGLRDQYHQEFVRRQEEAKRATKAELLLSKLNEIARSNMPKDLMINNLCYLITNEGDNNERQA